MSESKTKNILKRALKPIFTTAAALAVALPMALSGEPAMAQEVTSSLSTVSAANNFSLSSVSYASPWVLAGLGSLPLLWWLMRINPPRPRVVPFPSLRELLDIQSKEDQPASIPPWLRTLRYAAAIMAIVGLAQPLLNPNTELEGDGPVLLVVDNGAASARSWSARDLIMESVRDTSQRNGRDIILLPTAAPEDGGEISIIQGLEQVRRYMQGLESRPWPVDREAALKALEGFESDEKVSVIWLSNGLQDEGADIFAERLGNIGSLKVYQDSSETAPYFLSLPERSADILSVNVKRLYSGKEETLTIIARAEDGREIHRAEAHFEQDAIEARASFNLPVEIRNQLTSLSIDEHRGPAAVTLLDERYRRRPVGLVTIGAQDSVHPLLNEYNYIKEALDPFVDMRDGNVENLLERELAVMVLTGSTAFENSDQQRIEQWVREGGTLLRFAGPQLVENEGDDLLPVDIRKGGRTIGGTMSWNDPAKIAPFDKTSPFYGIDLPDDVIVKKQVLAEPSVNLRERTWAELEDGTPLVTAEKRDKGWVVLVHTTADPNWSNLAMSGLFVEMLRSVVAQSQGISGGFDNLGPLHPWMTLNGDGRLVDPSPSTTSLSPEAARNSEISPRTPPGFYGDDSVRRAHNISAQYEDVSKLSDLPDGTITQQYAETKEVNLKAFLLAGAFLLFALDWGVLQRRERARNKNNNQGGTPGTSGAVSGKEAKPKPS